MKSKLSVLTASLAIASLLVMPYSQSQEANAKDIGKELDAMWNMTKPGFSGKGPNGAYTASLGGINARFPVREVRIFSYDPPRFKAGCGGIDPYFGSFSLISKDNIKQVMNAIIANAFGYSLELALGNVCKECRSIYSDLRGLTQSISTASFNTCQLSSEAVDWIAGQFKNPDSKNSESSAEAVQSVNDGRSKDMNDAIINAGKDPKANRQNNADALDTKYGNNLLNTYVSAGLFNKIDTSVFGGDQAFFEIAMSLIGTNIMTTGANKDINDHVVSPIWSFKNLSTGTPMDSDLIVLTCNDGFALASNKCQKVTQKKNTWKGTERYVLELLVGKQTQMGDKMGDLVVSKIQPDSIIAHLRDPNVKLNESRRQFLASLPVISRNALAMTAQMNDGTVSNLINKTSEVFGKQLASYLALTIVQQTRTAYNTNLPHNKRRADLSELQIKALDKLESDANRVKENEDNDMKIYMELIEQLAKVSLKHQAS